jgi:hypothetical protein
MIREDNITLETLTEDLANEGLTIKEYITRSEGTALFTVALNKVLLDKYTTFPKTWPQVMKLVKSDGRDIRFPDMNGVNPAFVPELAEIPFTQLDITSTTVVPDKYALRLGVSQEMIDDNEVSLLSWLMSHAGTKMAELEDIEAYKAMHTFNSTGAAIDTSVSTFKGSYNRGVFHTTGTLPIGTVSATAGNWEQAIASAIDALQGHTITLLGETFRHSTNPDTLLVHSSKAMGARKVLNATLVVMATGHPEVDGAAGGKTQLAGTNIWKGALKVVSTPYAPSRTHYVLDSKRGSVVFVQRHTPIIDKDANWAYDAQEVRTRSRFIAAVVESRGICNIGV